MKVSKKGIVGKILCGVLITFAFAAFWSARWYIEKYGNTGFSSVLYSLLSGFNGAAPGLVGNYLLNAVIPMVLCSAASCFVLFYGGKTLKIAFNTKKSGKEYVIYPLRSWLWSILSIVLSSVLLINAINVVSLPQWLQAASEQTEIYDNEYIDPSTVDITFPSQKRNLIYIYLESMETTYLSTENGGGLNNNLIPELYTLAKDNINFSHNDDVGGWKHTTDTGWTVASLVAQTAGVPLSGGLEGNSYGQGEKFLPGVTTLNDILKNAGYYQAFMVGSDAEFAGRDKYFSEHGVDKIYDLFTARKDGIIPEDYFVWWGMEDKYLYEYAKLELSKISQNKKPFAFGMLTVDTHHIGGYKCEKCTDTYAEQYDNVISCASRQINEFINWIKQQDFYENTTVIIVGDHCSMDAEYFSRNIDENYQRHIYNCIINAAKEPVGKTKQRVFTPLDMFPTTLASIGCDIEGNRLGLGVNLFSPQKTFAEKYSIETLNNELAKTSRYYLRNFMR